MDTGDIRGPGLLFVQSRITQPDVVTEDVFMHWYDTDHIPEVLATSGVHSALRWKHDKAAAGPAPLPYLSVYPLDDIAFLRSDEFKAISVASPLLPGSGLCYDLAAFGVGYYNIVQVADPTQRGPGHATVLVAEQAETPDAGALDRWYRSAYLPALAAHPGYLRSTRYALKYARSNEQSRRFKGLPATGAPPPPPPTWLALHEFEAPVDEAALAALASGTASGAAVTAAATTWQTDVFHLAKTHGTGDLFHGRTF